MTLFECNLLSIEIFGTIIISQGYTVSLREIISISWTLFFVINVLTWVLYVGCRRWESHLLHELQGYISCLYEYSLSAHSETLIIL